MCVLLSTSSSIFNSFGKGICSGVFPNAAFGVVSAGDLQTDDGVFDCVLLLVKTRDLGTVDFEVFFLDMPPGCSIRTGGVLTAYEASIGLEWNIAMVDAESMLIVLSKSSSS